MGDESLHLILFSLFLHHVCVVSSRSEGRRDWMPFDRSNERLWNERLDAF
jgi:hypothetical protein